LKADLPEDGKWENGEMMVKLFKVSVTKMSKDWRYNV
jgi:hypothetical protein